ncbi:MAG: type II toxin-antitoxin system VapC family toxin [Actinomycetota bacterium]
MKLLLDTHALIWAAADPQRLPPFVRAALVDRNNLVAVSAASAWEIAIKRSTGRLRFPKVDKDLLARGGFRALPIEIHHAAAVESLPQHHSDPFDRMLLAQAQTDDYLLVTHDPAMHRYGIAWVWDGITDTR